MHRVFLVALMRLQFDTIHTRTSCVTQSMTSGAASIWSRFAPMRLLHGRDAPAAIPDAIASFMLQRNRSGDPETRKRVGEALERAGFVPALAATGEQGLLLLRDW